MLVWADFPSGQTGLYGTNTSYMLNGIWAELPSTNFGGGFLAEDPDPNVTGNVFQIVNTQGTKTLRIVNPNGANSTTGVAFRLWQPVLPSLTSKVPMTSFRTSSNVSICSVTIQPDGAIRAHSGDNGATLGTSAPCVTANAWAHIEIKVVRHASAGTIEVRVNGNTVLNLTGLALGASDIGQVALVVTDVINGTLPYTYWKDFVLWDGLGSQVNNFQGSVSVRDLLPDGDISLNWTPSTGSTGWDLLDEAPPNDSDYISAGSPAPSPYVASLTNLPTNVTSVRGLISIQRGMKTDGGDCNIQMGLTPNNTNWTTGNDRPMTTAFTYWWDVSTLSPATASAWTVSEVNNAYIRLNRTL